MVHSYSWVEWVRSSDIDHRNKKLPVAPGITTRNKKLLVLRLFTVEPWNPPESHSGSLWTSAVWASREPSGTARGAQVGGPMVVGALTPQRNARGPNWGHPIGGGALVLPGRWW